MKTECESHTTDGYCHLREQGEPQTLCGIDVWQGEPLARPLKAHCWQCEFLDYYSEHPFWPIAPQETYFTAQEPRGCVVRHEGDCIDCGSPTDDQGGWCRSCAPYMRPSEQYQREYVQRTQGRTMRYRSRAR